MKPFAHSAGATAQAGFSLIEIIITLGLSVAILFAGITVFLEANKWYLSTEANTASIDAGLVIMRTVGRSIENSGGGAVRSWMSTWIENSSKAGTSCAPRGPFPACQGSDRLTIATTPVPAAECSIESSSAGSVRLRSIPTCCLTTAPQQIMLVKGKNWSQRRVTGFNPATCELALAPGPMSPNDRGVVADWTKGTAATIRVVTYYLDPIKGHLHYFEDANGDGVADSGEDKLIADGVFDFQVALGYDFAPMDGFVSEGDPASDEILHNQPGEVLGSDHFVDVIPMNLQSVVVGVITGGRNGALSHPSRSTGVLDGVDFERTGWVMKRIQGQFVPRHSYLF